ncbi:MAG: hypothetical protein DME76_02480 [Verrucomicrobia bacterium]|nr:MAG: hypothetical protein DME76_02480 [Verrucomicrobiota bacterium]
MLPLSFRAKPKAKSRNLLLYFLVYFHGVGKATRGRVRTPKASRHRIAHFGISHEVLWECGASSHRFSSA